MSSEISTVGTDQVDQDGYQGGIAGESGVAGNSEESEVKLTALIASGSWPNRGWATSAPVRALRWCYEIVGLLWIIVRMSLSKRYAREVRDEFEAMRYSE